jgi:LacI family transcriptional regulator
VREEVKHSVTIRDIAKIAGVSHSTVSRCLNDSPQVSEKTKALVCTIAKDMNFHFNVNARALVSQKTGTIGILYPETYDDPRNLQYTKLLLHDLQENLADYGYDALMNSKNDRRSRQSNIRRLVACHKVDGLILIRAIPDSDERQVLEEFKMPIVLVDTPATAHDFDIYATNNLTGARNATDCLIERGRCASLLTISMGPGDSVFEDRSEGFRQSARDHGMPFEDRVIELPQGSAFEAGYSYAKTGLAFMKELRVDGIFAQADLLALGLISALREDMVSVPGGIRIVGFDDATIASYFQPRLTTMHQPREKIAYSVCARLKYLIDSETKLPRVVESILPTLILRESC